MTTQTTPHNSQRESNGFRPIRWDCARDGCFNEKCRARFDELYDALPSKISFTDLDGIVEVNGRFLVIEWKHSRHIPQGQLILFQQLAALPQFTVIVLVGKPQLSLVKEATIIFPNKPITWYSASLASVKEYIRKWCRKEKFYA